MAKNSSDAQLVKASPILYPFALAENSIESVERSLRRVVRDIHALRRPYADVVRTFQAHYIVGVLIKHDFHLGRTAEELGMHRNTLRRTIRELEIDWKHLRKAMHVCPAAGNPHAAVSLAIVPRQVSWVLTDLPIQ